MSDLVEKDIINLSGSSSSPGVAGDGVLSQPVAPVGSTPIAQRPHGGKPMTLPQFDPLLVESSEGFKKEARLKVCLARLQVEKEERDREFNLKRELELRCLEAELARAREVELKKVEAETTIKLRQLELQQGSFPVAAPVLQPVTTFDVSKNSPGVS